MWITACAAAQREAKADGTDLAGKAVRFSFRVNLSGHAARIRLGNLYGQEYLRLTGASIRNGREPAPLTFGGEEHLALSPGEIRVSDEASLSAEPGDELTVQLNFSEDCGRILCGSGTYRAELLTEDGEATGAETLLPAFMNLDLLCGKGYAVAVFGDSITEMRYWTDCAEERALRERPGEFSLLNLGISGGRLLYGTGGRNKELYGERYGDAGLERAKWDLFPLSGLRTVLLAMGINDISQPGSGTFGPPLSERCTAQDYLLGVRVFAARAHAAGLRVIGCTITPFGGMPGYCEETEALRGACNQGLAELLREGVLDDLADFAGQVEDPDHPGCLLPSCDLGDHLHPGPEGGRRMERALAGIRL